MALIPLSETQIQQGQSHTTCNYTCNLPQFNTHKDIPGVEYFLARLLIFWLQYLVYDWIRFKFLEIRTLSHEKDWSKEIKGNTLKVL